MTTVTAPMTKLDAVNMMLTSIGQAPVNTLSVSGIRDVEIAELALDNATREVLSRGWSFNTDEEYTLSPDGSDNVLVPATALQVDPTANYKRYVIRDNSDTLMMWDKEDHTFTITDDVDCDIIWAFEFEKIPQVARNYIATKAARLFQANIIGSDILFKYTELHEREAYATFKKSEANTKDRNMLTSGAEVNRIFGRRSNPTRY